MRPIKNYFPLYLLIGSRQNIHQIPLTIEFIDQNDKNTVFVFVITAVLRFTYAYRKKQEAVHIIYSTSWKYFSHVTVGIGR